VTRPSTTPDTDEPAHVTGQSQAAAAAARAPGLESGRCGRQQRTSPLDSRSLKPALVTRLRRTWARRDEVTPERSPVWRFRLVATAVALSYVGFGTWALLAPDSGEEPQGGVLPQAAAVIVILGWAAAIQHGLAEQPQPPKNAADVGGRQRRLLRRRTLSALGFTGGLLALVVVTTDLLPLALTALVLLVGLVHKPAGRTCKVATVLARDLDALLRLNDQGPQATKTSDWAKACDDLLLSGGSGLNSGFALGWWAAPAIHPSLQQRLQSHRHEPGSLPDDLHGLLVAHRSALRHLLDVAA
jgi:hypothetical protein